MTASILAILAVLVPFVIWLWKRRDAKEDDPENQRQTRQAAIAREIVRNDETGANLSLDADLDKLRSLQGHSRGQDGPAPQDGPAIHPPA
jgi:hypothetical protein